jgi:hypothetical protein
MTETADLEIGLHRRETGSYTVEFRYSQPDSDADIRLAPDQPAQATFDLDALNRLEPDARAYGQKLSECLFASPAVVSALAEAQASSGSLGVPLRLRLLAGASAPELHALRWETLLDPKDNTPLATSQNVLLSRYLSSLDWRPVRLRARGSLRALAAAASPANLAEYSLAPIDVPGELGRVKEGLAGIPVDFLPGDGGAAVSLNALFDRLRDSRYDIFYLVCHGALVQSEPWLWLEGEDRQVARVSGIELARRMKELEERPRLVVLASCESAAPSLGGAMASLAPRLVEAGIPAVLAMQGKISLETVASFMPVFFAELQADGRIDRALAVARGAVRERPDHWMPALFMRLKSGRLWYTPGYSQPSGGEDFENETGYIRRLRCTPILGPGLIESLTGPSREIARNWAESFHYPMSPTDRDALPKVAQYLATDKGQAAPFDNMEDYLRRTLRQRFKEALPADLATGPMADLDALVGSIAAQRRAADPLDAYRVLARLPFPLYLVANPDRLLEDALQEAGRKPQTMISPWNARLASQKTVFDVRPEYEPSPEEPFIFYLFGRWNNRSSMVLTEDEYIRYLIGFTGNRAFVPESVRLALSDTLLLFLGFQTDDWAFRVIFHSILAQAGSGLLDQYAHIAAQIEPEDERTLEPLRARRYLEKYFLKGANISIFWGRAEEYLAGLMQKWEMQS